jgi:polyferredoxin
MSLPAATWVRPPARGRLHRSRRALQVATSLMFIAAPFVGLLRFDVDTGHLVLLGTPFGLGDLQAVYALIILFTVLVFAGALLYGRIYCGWMCPQTTLSELVATVERWVCKRVKAKGACKLVSALTTTLVSAFVAASLVSYFLSPAMRLAPPRLAFIGWSITTVVLTGFLFLRHRFCLLVCPYGLLQNIIQDRSTLGVAFDTARRDECTGCLLCVRACFMGLDIRTDSLDPRCLNCGDCISATRIAKRCPEQPLIQFRYGSEPKSAAWPGWLRKAGVSDGRRAVIVAVTLALTVISARLLAGREDLELDIAAQFERSTIDAETVRNGYKLTLRNRLQRPVKVALELEGVTGVAIDAPAAAIEVGPTTETLVDVVLSAPACRFPEGANDLRVRVIPEVGNPVEQATFFFVPTRRSTCGGSSVSPSPASSASSLAPGSPPSGLDPSSSTSTQHRSS